MKSYAAAAAVAGGVLVAGCSGSSGPTAPGPQPSPPSHSGPQVVRAARVDRFGCQGAFPTHAQVELAARDIHRLVLCALPTSRSRTTVILRPGDSAFAPLVTALAEPDAAKSTGPCPEYADLTQLIFATTTAGRVLVHIPVDGCDHYEGDALKALNQARGAGAAG